MSSLCKVTLIGFIGRDAQLKYTGQGQPVCEFSLAVSQKSDKGNDPDNKETTWFQISLWGKLAENSAQYFNKGRQVFVEGNFRAKEYTKEGKVKYSLEVYATDFRFLNNPNNQQPVSSKPAATLEDPFLR